MTMFGFSKCGSSRCPAIVISTILAVGLAVGLALGAAGPARAQSDAEALQVNPVIATQAATGPRTSDFEPPLEDDRSFVTDAAPDLDTGCVFRNFGTIDFDVKVTRAVVMSADDLNPDGTLKNAQAMIDAGVLGPKAFLTMPALDVDVAGAPGFPPEVDEIFFNGEKIGELTGINDKWVMNTFDIPIGKLRFPAPAASGSAPQKVANTVQIAIDTASDPSDFNWCTSIDWGALRFKATSPVVLVHGLGSDGGIFERQGFTAALDAKELQSDNSIFLLPQRFRFNAGRIALQISPIANRFGVDSLHMVGHSQGGLDSRAYLALFRPRKDRDGFEVLSLSTLASPHNGTVIADIMEARKDESVRLADEVRFSGFPFFADLVVTLVPELPAVKNFTTEKLAIFNARNLPGLGGGTVFGAVASDADRDGNMELDDSPDEFGEMLQEMQIPDIPFLTEFGLNRVYLTLRRVAAIEIVFEEESHGPIGEGETITVAVITAIPNEPEVGNDIVVAIPSGLGQGSFAAKTSNVATFDGSEGRNHISVLNQGVAQSVIPWILQAETENGDLRPFKE
ncbi:MAG: hypothetical protein V3U23_02655 [Kiloniellales bacterium]|jgi:pimeloyl-ACP methyl ester carboxylesterase